MRTPEKLIKFAELLQKDTQEQLVKDKLDCDVNLSNAETHIKEGKKYVKIDNRTSGRFMIDEAGQIFGIKAYGVINRGHFYGTLDTINDYFWGHYSPQKKVITHQVFNRDSGMFVGNFSDAQIKEIGFKTDNFTISK